MLKEKKVSVLIKKYILYVLILEGGESICSLTEGKEKYRFSSGIRGKVFLLIRKKRESICSHKEEKRNYLFS